jgi:hypothetical protein
LRDLTNRVATMSGRERWMMRQRWFRLEAIAIRLVKKEGELKIFLVERDLQGISLDGLADAKSAAVAGAERMSANGTSVRYLRSTFVPADGRCMCLFEAECVEDVRYLNELMGLPYENIVDAYDLTPTAIQGA